MRGRFGPALVVASVVLGPGSIVNASKVGAGWGMSFLWVLLAATLLMAAVTALAGHVGATAEGTPCEVLAQHAGRPAALVVGLVLFGVVACFQFTNNIGVLAALEPLVGGGAAFEVPLLIALNALAGAALFGWRELYGRLELVMKVLVGVMALGFIGNLLLARPNPGDVVAGFVPRLPDTGGEVPWPVIALVMTTLSVAGAFWQAYLVRAKGWGPGDVAKNRADALLGIAVLGGLTATILITAATVLAGRVEPDTLSTTEISHQLEPLFGTGARVLFGLGLLGGAVSSFLVNAWIGGTVLADSLGLGGDVDGPWARRLTVVALAVGLVVAALQRGTQASTTQLITLGQALTVLGNPVLAAVLVWLGWRQRAPLWMRAGGVIGFIVMSLLAVRTASMLLG